MRVPRYIEPTLSAIFLTSASIHLVTSRRTYSEERAKLTAQKTILEDLISRVRQGERIPDAEYSRLMALASFNKADAPAQEVPSNVDDQPARGPATSWKEVLLGRKPSVQSNEELEEQARLEWEEGLHHPICLHVGFPTRTQHRNHPTLAALRPTSASEHGTEPFSDPISAPPSLPTPTLDLSVTETRDPMRSHRYL